MRNRRGFLTVDALRDGLKEQHATIRGGRCVVIELSAKGDGFVVIHREFDKHDVLMHSVPFTFDRVDPARDQFRLLVRKLGWGGDSPSESEETS